MSLPRSYRQLDALCLLFVVAAFASNALALNVSAETVKRRSEAVEVASDSNLMLMPAKTDDALFIEEAQSKDGMQVFAGDNTRGQCWKLPARATLAAFDMPDADELLRRPAIFWNVKAANVSAVKRIRALRPVCLMPLPFTPDRKNNLRQLAALTQPARKAS